MEITVIIVWGLVFIGVGVQGYIRRRAEKKKRQQRNERFRILYELAKKEIREGKL